MIYQINKKIFNFQFSIFNDRQAGVTLLLAILILASVLAISFSLATIMFIEVRTSGDLLKTEPALYAATGVGEQAMFNLERHVCKDGTSNPCSYTTSFSNNVTMPVQPTTLSVSTPIFTDKVKVGSNSISTTLNKYDFCDVTAGALGCQYGKVTVSYTSGSSDLKVYLCEFDATGGINYPSSPCTQVNTTGTLGVNQGYWNISGDGNFNNDGGTTLNLTTRASVTWNNLSPNLQQQLILVNSGSTDIYVKISTFGADGVTGKGLPYVGKTAVDINILNAAVGRKIQIVVPNSSGGTGSSGSPALNLDFELGSAGSCPTNWTCTGDAVIASASDGQGCSIAGGINGSQYLKAGCDGTIGTAKSQNFTLPASIDHVRALRAGGADPSSGSGWFIKKASDGTILCSAQNGTDADTFFSDDCSGLSGYAGTLVNIYVVDNQNSGWGKTYLDNIQLMDASNNVLSLGSGGSVNTTNYAAAANGGAASASSEYSNGQFPASSAIDGDRKGVGWGEEPGVGTIIRRAIGPMSGWRLLSRELKV